MIEYVKEAVTEDKNENYERAFELYMTALEYFKTHLKYEKNPRSKEAITVKVRWYCCLSCDMMFILLHPTDVQCSSKSTCSEQRISKHC